MKTPLIAALLGLAASTASYAEVEVQHGYVRATAPGAPNSAGFMVLYNGATSAVLLNGVTTPAATTAELHNHVDDNGIMRMRPVESISIPAGGMVELKPGGYHLMLMGLEGQLKEGDNVTLELRFSDQSTQQLQLPVRRAAPAQQHDDGHGHDHAGMKQNSGHTGMKH